MLQETKLFPDDDEESFGENNKSLNKDSRIKILQKNLIMMGFDISMVNKVISIFKIRTENEALNYLIKSENGKWNHPFIPKEKDNMEENDDLFEKPRTIVNNVVSMIKGINTQSELNATDDDIKDNHLIENICEICGESQDLHNITEFSQPKNESQNGEIKKTIELISKDNFKINIDEEDSDSINNDIFINKKENAIQKIKIDDDDLDQNNCGICMGEFDDPIEIEKCKHKFCRECFHEYLKDLIKFNKIDKISCPNKNCNNKKLSQEYFSKFLTDEEYFKYRQFKAQNEIARDPKKAFCPYPNCNSYAQINEGKALIIDSNNPKYSKSILKCMKGHKFCSCGRYIHEGDCEDKKTQKFINKNTKPCPKCGIPIIKNKGCNHMTCIDPSCRYEFCWICLKETVPNHYDYGPCAGKQFIDTDTFSYRMNLRCPCCYIILKILIGFGIFIGICIFPCLAVTLLWYYAFVYEEKKFQNYTKFNKIFILIMYILLGIANHLIGNFLLTGFLLLTGLIIITLLMDIFFEVCVFIFNCLFCCCLNKDSKKRILLDNFNENNIEI